MDQAVRVAALQVNRMAMTQIDNPRRFFLNHRVYGVQLLTIREESFHTLYLRTTARSP